MIDDDDDDDDDESKLSFLLPDGLNAAATNLSINIKSYSIS